GALLEVPEIDWVVPVIHPGHEERFRTLALADARLLPAVTGGASRQASVLAGLQALQARKPDHVLIHDAVRPFVEGGLIEAVLLALEEHQAALPVVPVIDTIKRSTDRLTVAATQ